MCELLEGVEETGSIEEQIQITECRNFEADVSAFNDVCGESVTYAPECPVIDRCTEIGGWR